MFFAASRFNRHASCNGFVYFVLCLTGTFKPGVYAVSVTGRLPPGMCFKMPQNYAHATHT